MPKRTRVLAVAEGPRDATSIKIFSTAAQLYEKNPIQKGLQWVKTFKVTQGHRNCRYSTGHQFLLLVDSNNDSILHRFLRSLP